MMQLLAVIIGLAFSYIPHSHFILKKSAETHGKGIYRVQQEVIFQTADDRAIIQESWWVTSGNQMYLEARGPQTAFTGLYEEQSKFYLQPNSKISSAKLPIDFFEGYFHYRSVNEFARAILRSGITSNEILTPQRRHNQLKDIEYKPQGFVRLSRTNGTIAYAFGQAVTGDTSRTPALWIEQDTFRVRRLRFKSGNEISADEYELYSNGLEFPRSRTLTYNDMKITIRTLNVTAAKPPSSYKEMLSAKAKLEPNGNGFAKSPLGEKIQKFYQEFR
jgi:hypothetical protein